MNLLQRLLSLSIAILSLLHASESFASVKVFQAGQRPTSFQEDLRLDGVGSARFSKGLASQDILRYVRAHAQSFGLSDVTSEILPLRGAHASAAGFSFRFIQRFNRVHIEGAELVAIFDSRGQLTAINSSLTAIPAGANFTVQPSISRETALNAALARLRYADPELGEGSRDGLLIVNNSGRPLLVWQFSIRERKNGERASQVQVIAQGASAGRIFKMINIAHATLPKITIYDASLTFITPNPLFKGLKVLEDGRETNIGTVLVSGEARKAHENLGRVAGFYSDHFQRNSYDGNNAEIIASVNAQKIKVLDLLGMSQNAAWMGPWKMFVFGGGGDALGDFASALDVVGHEFTHAVIGSSSDLAYEGQSGALNEHLADVFGAIIEQNYENPAKPFLMGDTVLRGKLRQKAEALRDMLNPEKGLSPQPANIKDTPAEFAPGCKASRENDNCGVHMMSGVPNRASALIIERLGWKSASELFYRVMTQRLRSHSDFADYANQLADECRNSVYPTTACADVEQALRDVGLR